MFSSRSLFHIFCSTLIVIQLSVYTDRGREVVKQKVNMHGKGEGGELKSGRNVRTSYLDDRYRASTGHQMIQEGKLNWKPHDKLTQKSAAGLRLARAV